MKATLWSHLDCQGGLPQNTLARSTFKNLDCQGGQPAEYLGQEQGSVEYVPEILSEFFLQYLGFSQYSSLYKYFQIFSICPNSLAPECYIAQLVQCNVVFLVENGVHQFLHLVLRSFFNYQTFPCIKYHVSSD